LRVVPQSESHNSNGRGACFPTEAVRDELLDGLARTSKLCAEAPSASDQGVQQTKNLLKINQDFIAALVVCHSDAADLGLGWTTRSVPSVEKPKVAVAPVPAPPKPAAAAPPPTPPKSIAAAPPPTPPCLEIAPAKDQHYALINRRCRGHTVLAVIETHGEAGETVCTGYSISQSLAIRVPGGTPPRVNHECVSAHASCNKARLGNMFPECDW
jgi:hypothetical protein